MSRVTGGTGNVIGGTVERCWQLISGNGSNGNFGVGVNIGTSAASTVVQGNKIGTDVLGTAALPNANGGVNINNSNNNTVGGTTANARNLISGNGSNTGLAGNAAEGINILGTSTGNQVTATCIGTDVSGAVALPNATSGVRGVFISASGNTVGGTAAGAGNLISGNGNGHELCDWHLGERRRREPGPRQPRRHQRAGDGSGPQHGRCDAHRRLQQQHDRRRHGRRWQPPLGQRRVRQVRVRHRLLRDGIDNLVQGNKIGTDISGTVALGNTYDGVFISSTGTSNLIGGRSAGEANTSRSIPSRASALPREPEIAIRGNQIFSNGRLASISFGTASRRMMWATPILVRTTCRTSR